MSCGSFLLAQKNSPDGWQRLDGDLNAVRFSSNGNIFICGTNGIIMRSLDSGTTWQQPYCPFSGILNGIADLGNGIVLAVGENGEIVRSIDTGKTWNIVQSGVSAGLFSLYFTKDKICFIGGANGTILRSTDIGLSWQQIQSNASKTIRSLFADNGWLYSLCDGGEVELSQDNGLTWKATANSKVSVCSNNSLACQAVNIYKYGNGPLQAVLYNFMRISTNRGVSWEQSSPLVTDDQVASFEQISDTRILYTSSSKKLRIYDIDKGSSEDCTYPNVLNIPLNFSNVSFYGNIGIAVGPEKRILKSTDNGGTWYFFSYCESQSKFSSLQQMQAVDDDHYFALGTKQPIYHTTDGGSTWLPNNPAPAPELEMVNIGATHFFDKNTGIVARSGMQTSLRKNGLLRSFDGGSNFSTFQELSVPDNLHYFFTDKMNGLEISFIPTLTLLDSENIVNRSLCRTTIDGGFTWTLTKFADTVRFTSTAQGNGTQIIVGGRQPVGYKGVNGTNKIYYGGARIYHTSDTGKTWEQQNFNNIAYLRSIAFVSDNTFIAVGLLRDTAQNAGITLGLGIILKTTNSGISWSVLDSNSLPDFSSIAFANDGLTGFATGFNGTFLSTTDGGESWARNDFATDKTLNEITALTPKTVIITGAQGMILKKAPKQILSNVEEQNDYNLGVPVWLRSPYPNPFSNKIHIESLWQNRLGASNTTLKIYSATGVMIEDLSNYLSANQGTYYEQQTIQWSPTNLSAGMYFVVIQGGGYAKAMPVFYIGE